jgi:hypothetical protein
MKKNKYPNGNEWHPDGKMVADGAISIVKVRNLLKKSGITNVIGKNIRINGQLRGCYGFAICPDERGNERIVYFDTEVTFEFQNPSNGRILYRYAKSTNDFVGGLNHYCDFKNLGKEIKAMFDWYEDIFIMKNV